jgi:hypothetical protein
MRLQVVAVGSQLDFKTKQIDVKSHLIANLQEKTKSLKKTC